MKTLRWLPALGLLAVTGCADLVGPNYDPADPFNPFNRAGTWRPTGANDSNLRVMVDRPGEILVGTGAVGSDGNNAARAVERYRTGNVRPLPTTSTSDVAVQFGATAAGAGAGAGAGSGAN